MDQKNIQSMKQTIFSVLLFWSLQISSRGQGEEKVKISICDRSDVIISQIDIIGGDLPQDEDGNQVSRINNGFTTLYMGSAPKIPMSAEFQNILRLFDGRKKEMDLSVKPGVEVPVGLEPKRKSFVMLRKLDYFLIDVYPQNPSIVTLIQLRKLVERDCVNVYSLQFPYNKKVFDYPELARFLIDVADNPIK